MVESDYRADRVDPCETAAMKVFALSYGDGKLREKENWAFNVLQYGQAYRVQAGFVEGNSFIRVGETTDISMPAGLTLENIAEAETRLPGKNIKLFINGKEVVRTE